MIQIFSTLFNGLGMSIENWVCFILMLGVLLFAAKDFKLAAIIGFALFTVTFIIEYSLYTSGSNVAYQSALVLALFWLMTMAWSLFFTKQASAEGFY